MLTLMNHNRQSNVELMRIICFLMILIHHLITQVLFSGSEILGVNGILTSQKTYAITLNGFCYIGVNVFMLITGYFGIIFKWKGVLKLYLLLVFYAFFQCLCQSYIGTYQFSLGTIKYVFLVFTNYARTNLWFMNCYIIFYFLSPMIRLEDINKTVHTKILVLASIVNLYFGYVWDDYSNGYSVGHFIYIYIIGSYIRKFVVIQNSKRFIYLLSYLVFCSLFVFLSILNYYTDISLWKAYYYNNPVLLAGSIGFFMFMLTFSFHSNAVNRIAASSIGMYLAFNAEFIKRIIQMLDLKLGEGIFTMPLVAIALGVIYIMVDQVRIVVQKPVTYFIFFFTDRVKQAYSKYRIHTKE